MSESIDSTEVITRRETVAKAPQAKAEFARNRNTAFLSIRPKQPKKQKKTRHLGRV